jgi:hypothetical protein
MSQSGTNSLHLGASSREYLGVVAHDEKAVRDSCRYPAHLPVGCRERGGGPHAKRPFIEALEEETKLITENLGLVNFI